MPKTEITGYGFFAVCIDTENNAFALWEKTNNELLDRIKLSTNDSTIAK
jgi:hypothetical protein